MPSIPSHFRSRSSCDHFLHVSRTDPEVKDPFGVDLKAERQRARQARENRQLQPAERAQPTTEAAARDEQRQQLRAQQATDALTAQAAAIEAERQTEAKRRHLAGPARDGRHEREQIEDKAGRTAKAAEAIRRQWAQERERGRQNGRTR